MMVRQGLESLIRKLRALQAGLGENIRTLLNPTGSYRSVGSDLTEVDHTRRRLKEVKDQFFLGLWTG